ncbi:efflux RND transporter permease subunit [Halomonas nitroreducens]|uniref:Efflux RND transporter permease subunit n=1 Tax=Halomonas nitroreducens TaxID=447425 RepID=A0A3S0I8G8_9GAMM|nr:efflux RND transporter permease subunit [Halomonas nitroreducens]RTR04963.1 efflux RND transporter permease subunit [Halomonas nitroreducens]
MAVAGGQEVQEAASRSLKTAFFVAVGLMAQFRVIQFNSLYHAALVLAVIIYSTVGMLLRLLANSEPFGILMGGMAIIALAGSVVNNIPAGGLAPGGS